MKRNAPSVRPLSFSVSVTSGWPCSASPLLRHEYSAWPMRSTNFILSPVCRLKPSASNVFVLSTYTAFSTASPLNTFVTFSTGIVTLIRRKPSAPNL